MKPIVSAECEEHGGTITRHVYPMEFNVANLYTFWEKAKQFRVLFTDEFKNFDDFCNIFLIRHGDTVSCRGLFWIVDDFQGIFYLTDMEFPYNADVHFVWFDRKLNGRQELTKKMIEYVFETYQLNRLTANVPMYAVRRIFSFLKEVGFATEGRMKMTHKYNNQLYDSLIFGCINPKVLEEAKHYGQ